jgi:hypothetical protein
MRCTAWQRLAVTAHAVLPAQSPQASLLLLLPLLLPLVVLLLLLLLLLLFQATSWMRA